MDLMNSVDLSRHSVIYRHLVLQTSSALQATEIVHVRASPPSSSSPKWIQRRRADVGAGRRFLAQGMYKCISFDWRSQIANLIKGKYQRARQATNTSLYNIRDLQIVGYNSWIPWILPRSLQIRRSGFCPGIFLVAEALVAHFWFLQFFRGRLFRGISFLYLHTYIHSYHTFEKLPDFQTKLLSSAHWKRRLRWQPIRQAGIFYEKLLLSETKRKKNNRKHRYRPRRTSELRTIEVNVKQGFAELSSNGTSLCLNTNKIQKHFR